MAAPPWFDDVPVLGRLPADRAAVKLRELGEDAAADALLGPAGQRPLAGALDFLPFRERLWAHTAHAFGYLAPAEPGPDLLPIRHAGNIKADASLKGAPLRVALNRLRVAQYPGGGTHHILIDFYARHQTAAGGEDLHFNAAYRAREGEAAAVVGYPIFVGLSAGADGVAFRCFTVNVKNEQDEALLGFLDSDVFRGGLRLLAAAQPAAAPLSAMALCLTKALAGRSRNVAVQDCVRRAAGLCEAHMIYGYQGKGRDAVAGQVKALYAALREAGITYVNSVIDYGAGPGQQTQRTRLPRESLAGKRANCIDGTVLFASLLEGASLNAALVVVPGHALVA